MINIKHKINNGSMVCFAKLGLTENLYIVQKEKFKLNAICAICTRPSLFVKDKPTFSLERALHKDYDRKNSVPKCLWS